MLIYLYLFVSHVSCVCRPRRFCCLINSPLVASAVSRSLHIRVRSPIRTVVAMSAGLRGLPALFLPLFPQLQIPSVARSGWLILRCFQIVVMW
jgi:hypothetical protein